MSPLPRSARGPAWMLLACVAFAAMWMVIRLASATVHPFEIVFFRNVFGLVALLPMLIRRPALIDRKRAVPNLRRASSGLFATLGTFYAIANAPLATALAINYTAPLFAAVGAMLFLRERIHARRGVALAVGFVGMLVVVRPGALPLTPGIAAAVLSAVATAFSYLAIRTLVGRDDPRSVAAWQFILMAPPSFVVALFVWSWPSPAAWGLLVAIGVLAAIGQLGLAFALASAEASAVLPYDFVRFGLITLGGIVLFRERYDMATLGGGAIILAATIYLAAARPPSAGRAKRSSAAAQARRGWLPSREPGIRPPNLWGAMTMDLNGCAAVVTGGASGLGEATARALAAAGVRVAIFDRDAARGPGVAADIGGTFCAVDVTSDASVDAGFAAARAAHGQERILINCAGVGNAIKTASRSRDDGQIRHFPLDAFAMIIQINLIGTFRCIAKSAAGMLTLDPLGDGERGVIVNTASVAAEDGQVGQAAYSASKGGVVGMTLPIARDLMGEGIRVNTILPGIFNTPLMQGAPDKVKDALAASVPFPKRLGNPAEYASLALEMCRNSYFNGEDVRLDGAIRMAPR